MTNQHENTQEPLEPPLLPALPLLMTENADDFEAIGNALNREIRPSGIIEQIYVADIAQLVWEILRLRRCKTGVVNAAFRAALEELAVQCLRDPGKSKHDFRLRNEAEAMAKAWFANQTARRKVSKLLNYFHLDESAIEAEAIRASARDLEQLNRLLASLESRRDKALRRIAEYRAEFARQVRDAAERVIDGKALALEDTSGTKTPAAA
jgi:hypothetical protein